MALEVEGAAANLKMPAVFAEHLFLPISGRGVQFLMSELFVTEGVCKMHLAFQSNGLRLIFQHQRLD